MKLNIFKIPKEKVEDLKEKFKSLGLESINFSEVEQWKADFYFSKGIDPKSISWVEEYKDFFIDGEPKNLIYFAAYVWENDKYCFGISYGKSHFYLRQYCDHDFGTDIAKRVANKKDIRQKSSKKFAGKKKKEIKSYTKNTSLDIESGESIDYLQSSIIDEYKDSFGKTGKFGSSTNLNPEIQKEDIANFLNELVKVYESKELFSLPRTMIIDGLPETVKYEEKLIKDILSLKDEADFTSSSHDLVGVDFIFSGQEKYEFYLGGNNSGDVDLSMESLNLFIKNHSISEDQILNIRIKIKKEGASEFSRTLKESIDYIVDGQNVILSQGRWMRFNEDYLEQLNEYIDSFDLEEVENDLVEIGISEGDFNKKLEEYGYSNADKDFSVIKVKSGTLVEAWDSKKDETVYAIKRGTTQKLGYVCDQASNTLELINKRANIKKLDPSFKNYCIWLIMQRQNIPKKISDINSIILKQKIESWARKSLEFGITPKIKISKIIKVQD